MSSTNRDNLEERFDDGEDVLGYFETESVLNIHRLKELSAIVNLSALAREAGINVHTLQTKIKRNTPLSGKETTALIKALKRYHLAAVA